MSQLWSREGSWQRKIKDLADLTGSNTAVVATLSNCAPDTTKVLCPWHCKSSVPLAPQKCSCMCSLHEQSPSAQIFKPTQVVSEITSLSGVWASSGWSVVFLVYLWKLFHSFHFPRELNGSHYNLSQCPKMVSGQSPPPTPCVLDWQSL